jgi:chloramphenicol-sensitive protein RarD
MNFLLGVFLYDEPLTAERLTGFVMIWIALLIFVLEGYFARRRQIASVKAG